MQRFQGENANTVIWVIAIAVAIVVGIIWWTLPKYLSGSYTAISEKGSFGDMFGSVNALFTALAFVGLIVTILIQRKELQLQRHELMLQREEMQGQKDQLKLQNTTFKQQRLESTFFELLRVHNDIVASLFTVHSSHERHGRDCLRIMVLKIQQITGDNRRSIRVDEIMDALNENEIPLLEQYFKQLYQTVKFIDDSEIEEKQRFANFIQAQLDYNELKLLAYKGLSKHGKDFKAVIEKYGLLGNFAPAMFFDENHAKMYSGSAFTQRNGSESEGRIS